MPRLSLQHSVIARPRLWAEAIPTKWFSRQVRDLVTIVLAEYPHPSGKLED